MTVQVSEMPSAAADHVLLPPKQATNGGSGKQTTTAAQINGGSSDMLELCLRLKDKVERFLALQTEDGVLKGTQAQVRLARSVIDDALRRYRPDELALSYNGGKDCLVLLVLILASFPTLFPPFTTTSPINTSFPTSLQALYIRPPSPFPEVDAFVASSTQEYHLDLSVSDKPMKPALADYLKERENVKAVFVGTRRTDPHGGCLTFFDETDRDWPRFMRVHPVIDWHYREVWGFILALEIPYCRLYDMGYTSLGGTDDTHPNPALKADGGGKQDAFRPAYELMEDEEERLGRDW